MLTKKVSVTQSHSKIFHNKNNRHYELVESLPLADLAKVLSKECTLKSGVLKNSSFQ